MEEKILAKKRKRNLKLYPIYEMLGLDFLFYYGIQVLFLSQVKNIPDASILLASSLYALAGIFLQVPISMFVGKVGKHRALVIGNLINTICIGIILICPNFIVYLIEELLNAVAFGIKNVTESSILDSSIPETDRKSEIYVNIHSKGYSKYCYISAITTIIAGMLYDINPYIPVVLCMVFCAIATYLSYNFNEIDNKKEEISFKKQFKQLSSGFKFIFRSSRLKSLLISVGTIWGLSCLFSTYRVTILKELNCSATLIGIIVALFSIMSGLLSKKSNEVHEKLRNKTIITLMLTITVSFILIGIILLTNMFDSVKIFYIFILYMVIAGCKGINQVIQNRYLGNFANKKLKPLIYSSNSIIRNLSRMCIGFVGSLILSKFDVKYAIIIVGIIFTIFALILYKYMKTRLGLKPQEYKEKDIKFSFK